MEFPWGSAIFVFSGIYLTRNVYLMKGNVKLKP